MAKIVVLTYPDTVPYQRLLEDFQNLNRGVGSRSNSPAIAVDLADPNMAPVIKRMAERGITLTESGAGSLLAANQAIVTDEDELVLGAETFTFTVVDNEITAIGVDP